MGGLVGCGRAAIQNGRRVSASIGAGTGTGAGGGPPGILARVEVLESRAVVLQGGRGLGLGCGAWAAGGRG